MSWPSVANERRGTVAVFERALTEFHSVKLPRAANESRWRIDLPNMSVRKVCVRQGYRGTAPRCARDQMVIDDSLRGEQTVARGAANVLFLDAVAHATRCKSIAEPQIA